MTPARIVIIEDSAADVFLVELALKENGVLYVLTKFSSGQDALASLCGVDAAESLPPDAILLDLNTPRSDGFEVLGKLKQSPRLARVPIAILTSSDAASDKYRTILLGATQYISKPSHLAEFLATVGQAVKTMLQIAPES